MSKKPRENRVPIMMSDEEVEAIDTWRFENRVATRSDAARRLMHTGLTADANLQSIIDLVESLARRFVRLEKDWGIVFEKTVVDNPDPHDHLPYAAGVTVAVADWLPDAEEEIFEIHQRFVDLAKEINILHQSPDLPAALGEVKASRDTAYDRRQRWEERRLAAENPSSAEDSE